MADDYLPAWLTTEQACALLEAKAGGTWTMQRLLEYGLWPSVWLDWSPDAPAELFGDRREEFQAPFCFASDTQRLAFDGTALLTMTFRPSDGGLFRFKPGLKVELSALRFAREAVMRTATRLREEKAGRGRSPKWAVWSNVPTIQVWEGVALSLDIEPKSVLWTQDGWMEGPDKIFTEEGEDFDGRILVAERNVSPDGPLVPQGPASVGGPGRCSVSAVAFVSWASRIGWSMPGEMLSWSFDLASGEPVELLPEGGAARGAESVSNRAADGPAPLTTGAMAAAFAGCAYKGLRDGSESAWAKRLGSPAGWMEGARVNRGAPGLGASLWNPVHFALALRGRGVRLGELDRCFRDTYALRSWQATWESRLRKSEHSDK